MSLVAVKTAKEIMELKSLLLHHELFHFYEKDLLMFDSHISQILDIRLWIWYCIH